MNSSTPAFIRAVWPAVAIMQAGDFHRHGHPRAEILECCRRNGTKIVRTDLDGAIIFDMAPETLAWQIGAARRRATGMGSEFPWHES